MKRSLGGQRQLVLQAALLLAVALSRLAAPALAQTAAPKNTIERIDFRGNRRVPTATMKAHVTSQVGDIYNAAALQHDFMALYNTGLFEDITLRVEDGDTGKIVTFEVKERPTIRSIEYKGNKSVTQSDILDRFKDRNVGLTVESRYDPTKVKHAEVVIKELLSEHGRQYAIVKVDAKEIPPSSIGLTFTIDEGPKVKVGKIAFNGNQSVPSETLVRSMHNMRPVGVPHSLLLTHLWSKTFDKNKLDEDLEGVRGAYQDRGFFKIQVNDPKIADRTTAGGWLHIPLLYPNKPGRFVDITIPVLEGGRYYLGKMTFKNVTAFKGQDAALQALFGMQEGDLFDSSRVRKGLEQLTKLYGEYGYITFEANPDPEVDEANHRVNMTFDVEEGKQFVIRRIEFTGNTTTRDKVIRRELLLQEGALFNRRLWETSILRLNQLDYFDKLDPTKDAQIQTNNATGTVDIDLKVHEKGKNSIGFSGGVSGLSGSFVGFNFQTNNFMGLGETLTLDAQLGSVQRNITLGLTHPYMFDRPLQTGFTVYSRRYNFNESQQASILAGQDLTSIYNLLGAQNIQNYRQSNVGFTAFASYPIHNNFSRLSLTYGFDVSSITSFSTVSTLYFEDLDFNGFNGPSSLEGIRTSKVVPTYTYSTVDSPLTPTRGTGFFTSVELAGVGGNVRTYRPTVDYKWFHKVTGGGRVFGMHFLASTMDGYGGRVIPPFSRMYTGGENDIRGFDINTISPIGYLPDTITIPILNADGTPRQSTSPNQIGQEEPAGESLTIPINRITFPGGDTEAVGNFEYRIPLFGPVMLTFFTDVGNDIAWHRNQLTLTDQRQAQLTSIFPDINFPKTVIMAPGTNNQWRVSSGVELRVQVPILNVPVRVYWAYNPLRLETVLTPPSLLERASFPNEATYDSAVAAYASGQPYSEPAHTIRFTIGTTF